MAFTGPELIRIRAVLGYPNLFRYKNTRLESALVQADADGETYIRAELAAIAEVDAAIRNGGTAFDALGVRKVDEVEFQTGATQSPEMQARKMGRVHIARISSFFGVNVHSDYYGTSGFPGDWFADGTGERNSPLGIELHLG